MIIPGANEIIPGVWVGDGISPQQYARPRRTVCVLEGAGPIVPGSHFYPILEPRLGNRASRKRLDDAAWAIERLVAIERDPSFVAEPPLNPVLVHCAAGMERSPLTVAWWLVRSGRARDLDAAYEVIIKARPIAARRDAWLEELP